jgi:hypothetical protein
MAVSLIEQALAAFGRRSLVALSGLFDDVADRDGFVAVGA